MDEKCRRWENTVSLGDTLTIENGQKKGKTDEELQIMPGLHLINLWALG